jgi:hypothetical protein
MDLGIQKILFCPIFTIFEFGRPILIKIPNIKIQEIPASGSLLFHADR